MRIREQNNSGLVSIVIMTLIMLVITLIVIGFARISRQEQRQALDRELSTQAFYAAEAGINSGVEFIRGELNASGTISAVTNCGEPAGLYDNSVLDTGEGDLVEFSCVLIDPSPTELVYNNLAKDTAQSIRVQPTTEINTIRVDWGSRTDSPSFGCGPELTTESAWPCNQPALRIDVAPFNTNATFDSLRNDHWAVYVLPSPGGGLTSVSSSERGNIVQSGCVESSDFYCSIDLRITNTSQPVVLRVVPMYQGGVDVQVSATGGGARAELTEEQAVVDATGKASDVVRRLVARVPFRNTYAPAYAITADYLCKNIEYGVNIYTDNCRNTGDIDGFNIDLGADFLVGRPTDPAGGGGGVDQYGNPALYTSNSNWQRTFTNNTSASTVIDYCEWDMGYQDPAGQQVVIVNQFCQRGDSLSAHQFPIPSDLSSPWPCETYTVRLTVRSGSRTEVKSQIVSVPKRAYYGTFCSPSANIYWDPSPNPPNCGVPGPRNCRSAWP